MTTPLITVALPVYNGERFLERSLRCMLGQDFEDFELLISDNGSTDATGEICRAFAAADHRVTYLPSDRNRGLAWNWNRPVPLARGHFFKWVAADDEHEPAYLRRTLAALQTDPGAVLAHSRTVDIDEDGKVLSPVEHGLRFDAAQPHERFSELTRQGYPSVQIFGLVRTDVLRRTGLHGPYPRSDRALLAELGLHGRLIEVDEILFRRREFASRVTRSHDLRQRYAVFAGRPPRGPVFPSWRLLWEFWRAISRSPLPPAEKLRCLPALWQYVDGHRGSLKRDLRGALGRT